MRKCNGNNTEEWGFDAIFNLECKNCGSSVEFFKDDITRNCSNCRQTIHNDRGDYGCGQYCNALSTHRRNICSKGKRAKHRFDGSNLI